MWLWEDIDKMKRISVFVLACLFLVGCGSSQPEIKDNGHPGQIKAIVFFDANHNGILDAGEPGIKDGVSISQDISCPASNSQKITKAETDANGETTFKDLKPGRYCVAYIGSVAITTRLTNEVYLSSDQVAQVSFGLLEK
jgi:hypothetical protein